MVIAVVGAGAAGVVTTIRLIERSKAIGLPVRVALIDPQPGEGRGVAYSTSDPRHRMNVPAERMSANPDSPLDFVRWLNDTHVCAYAPTDFVPRAYFGEYLAHCLARAGGEVERVHARVIGLRAARNSMALHLGTGEVLRSAAVVLATGAYPPSADWANPHLRQSPGFIGDPWCAGALDTVTDTGDVLLVGTGLTMIDAALSLDRPGRVVHAASRHGWIPLPHARTAAPAMPPYVPPEASLAEVRRAVRAHVRARLRANGNWQSALDDLRPLLPTWWAGMPLKDRQIFLRRCRRLWDIHRHRIPVETAADIEAMSAAGRLVLHRGTISNTETTESGSLRVTLANGRVLSVAAVVNCTGPQEDVYRVPDPLVQDLLVTGQARPGPLGLGLDTTSDGRVLTGDGRAENLWTIGAPRRDNLWETTAFHEIRAQAAVIADAVLGTSAAGQRRCASCGEACR